MAREGPEVFSVSHKHYTTLSKKPITLNTPFPSPRAIKANTHKKSTALAEQASDQAEFQTRTPKLLLLQYFHNLKNADKRAQLLWHLSNW